MLVRRSTLPCFAVLLAAAAMTACAADSQSSAARARAAASIPADTPVPAVKPPAAETPAALQRCQDDLELQFAEADTTSGAARAGTPGPAAVAKPADGTGAGPVAGPAASKAMGTSPTTTAKGSKADAASGKAGGKAAPTPAVRRKYPTGDDPAFAVRMGWPPAVPPLKPGAILPCKRIVAYYGNPYSRKMGVLGEYDPPEMLRRFRAAVAEWNKADPKHPVQPAFQLIAVVAQGSAGKDGMYRLRMPDDLVQKVYGWAKQENALLILDVQVGLSTVQQELPRLEQYLKNPDVMLAIDPEFSMHYQAEGSRPGQKIGVMSAADINYASQFLESVVRKYNLPPKILVVHRFTRRMVQNADQIKLRPDVQIVMNMDGWGAEWLKRDSYKDYIIREPVEYTGFKIFYHNDVRKPGWSLMQPAQVLGFRPYPLYIQYQ